METIATVAAVLIGIPAMIFVAVIVVAAMRLSGILSDEERDD